MKGLRSTNPPWWTKIAAFLLGRRIPFRKYNVGHDQFAVRRRLLKRLRHFENDGVEDRYGTSATI